MQLGGCNEESVLCDLSCIALFDRQGYYVSFEHLIKSRSIYFSTEPANERKYFSSTLTIFQRYSGRQYYTTLLVMSILFLKFSQVYVIISYKEIRFIRDYPVIFSKNGTLFKTWLQFVLLGDSQKQIYPKYDLLNQTYIT